MTLALLLLAALGLAYANGSNDNFKAVATLYGSKTLPYKQALWLASGAQIAGSVASVLLAGALLKAFSGKGLVPLAVVGDPSFLLAVGGGAALTVLAATRVGLPISTTHALIGGLVGAGTAMVPEGFAWAQLGGKYFMPLLISPVLAVLAAALLYPPLRWLRGRLGLKPTTCVCVGGEMQEVQVAPDGSMTMARTGLPLHFGDTEVSCVRRYEGELVGVSAQRVVDSLHMFSGFALGFARGLNDTPKILALLVAAGWAALPPQLSLGLVAVAMVAGGLLHSRRIARTMGERITTMNHGQGLVANSVGSSLVIGASLLGSPVSTTHVSTGAIFGIGLWTGRSDWKVVGGIVLAWVGTLPLGAALAYALASLI